jgi:hypothetical protein
MRQRWGIHTLSAAYVNVEGKLCVTVTVGSMQPRVFEVISYEELHDYWIGTEILSKIEK